MVPNQGGEPLGSILGPVGSHWVQKMGQNRRKLPCPKIRIFVYPSVIDISQKMEVTVMAPNHGGDTIESILGPMGCHWFQKMGQNLKKLPCPKIRIFDYPAVIGFSPKMEFTVMVPNHGGDPLGSILGPVGSHWVKKKCVKTVKNYFAPKFEFSITTRSSIFPKKMEFTVLVPTHGGDPLGSILGPMGPHLAQKRGQTVKNYHALKFEFSITLRSSVFHKKMELTVMAPNHGGDPLGSILGPKGLHWVQKMFQNRKKLTCPKIRIFDYPAVIGFSQKMEVTVMAPNHGGDPLGSILGPMGSHWVQKMGQNRKKLPCPKIRIFDYPADIDFSQKNGSYGYGAKSWWGTPRVHLGASGVPLGKKKWVKTVKNYHAPKFEFSITPRSSIFPKKWNLWLWCQITVGTP